MSIFGLRTLMLRVCLFLFVIFPAMAYGSVVAEYVRNYDGDTITVNLSCFPVLFCKDLNIRVKGIDTPEMRGACDLEKAMARKAKFIVGEALQKAKKITLSNMSRGKYFRVVADVDYDGKSLSSVLLNANLSVSYDGGRKKKDWCGGY